MVTISDVAHAAGVSKATVSYVLSGDPRITQATTLKVQHAIDELGYTVNHAARALSVRKTKTIGVGLPRLSRQLSVSPLWAVRVPAIRRSDKERIRHPTHWRERRLRGNA